MRPARCRRCWPSWALVSLAWFAYLERQGYYQRCRHHTLSRELRDLLGWRGCWLFTVLGLIFTWHLLTLPDLQDPVDEGAALCSP